MCRWKRSSASSRPRTPRTTTSGPTQRRKASRLPDSYSRMHSLLEESFRAAVAAADPLQILAPHLPQPPKGRTFVAAAGKAAASMAFAVEQHFTSELEGIAITRYGHGLPTKKVRVVEAGHPVPDEAGEAAAREILQKTKALTGDDLLLALLSGGGSSLLSLPAPDIPMADLKA